MTPSIELDPWAELIAAYGKCHENAPAAFAKARQAGLDPSTFAAVTFDGVRPNRLPVLWFGDVDAGNYTAVTPVGGTHYIRLQ